MTTLAEFMIIAGADNRPLMLEKSLYDSWKIRMEHYMENRENGRMILKSVQNGPLIWPTVTDEDGTTKTKKYEELSATEKIQADCNYKATNIVLQGLPLDVYAIVNHHKFAKEIWDRVKLLMQGTKLSLQEKECKLYDEFDKFTFVKGETLPQNAAWFKEKAMLAEAQEAGQILDEEQLAFLADPRILDGQVIQKTIPNNTAFQTEDLDTYDSDCDDVSNAKAVLMANLSSYGSDVLSEEPFQMGTNARNHWKKEQNVQINLRSDRPRVYSELSQEAKDRYMQTSGQQTSTQGPTKDLLSLTHHYIDAKDKLYNVKIRLEGRLTKEDQNLIDNLNQHTCLTALQSPQNFPMSQTNNHLRISSNPRNQATEQRRQGTLFKNVQVDRTEDRLSATQSNGLGSHSEKLHSTHIVHKNFEYFKRQDDEESNPVQDFALNVDILCFKLMTVDAMKSDVPKQHNEVPVVQNNASMVPNDAYVMIDNDLHDSDVRSVSHTPRNTVANNLLNAELATYKEQVELYERRARFELTEREQKIDEQLRIVICDRNIKEENLKKELHSIKLQLASTIQHNKLMVDEVTSLKKDFNQKENKFLEEFLDLKALKDKVEDKLFKQGQSIQTVHMMCKPRSYYDEVNKVAIGYKNPLCLHRARQVQPALYSGHVIVTPNHAPAVVRDCEETLEQSEISRKKMHDKMKANECVDNK
ncbi:hypothetical protein Tco_0324017, partial [Tanacetum coccineum]